MLNEGKFLPWASTTCIMYCCCSSLLENFLKSVIIFTPRSAQSLTTSRDIIKFSILWYPTICCQHSTSAFIRSISSSSFFNRKNKSHDRGPMQDKSTSDPLLWFFKSVGNLGFQTGIDCGRGNVNNLSIMLFLSTAIVFCQRQRILQISLTMIQYELHGSLCNEILLCRKASLAINNEWQGPEQ